MSNIFRLIGAISMGLLLSGSEVPITVKDVMLALTAMVAFYLSGIIAGRAHKRITDE